jgi:Na+/melibiose symporter-like transporter
VYVGFFTFLRKLGGASAVLLMGVALELAGYDGGAPRAEQSALALETIRVLTSLVPAFFLGLAIWVALGYPLGRVAHQKVLDQLHRRNRSR